MLTPDLLTVMVGLLEDLNLCQSGLVAALRQTVAWCGLETQPWPPPDAHAVWGEIDPGAPHHSPTPATRAAAEAETGDLNPLLGRAEG